MDKLYYTNFTYTANSAQILGGDRSPSPPVPMALVRGLEWWTRMEKNVAKQNISDAIIITPYAQNKIPSKRFAPNFVKK